jgi:hypothetical protein
MRHTVIWDVQYGEKRVKCDVPEHCTKRHMTHPWAQACREMRSHIMPLCAFVIKHGV